VASYCDGRTDVHIGSKGSFSGARTFLQAVCIPSMPHRVLPPSSRHTNAGVNKSRAPTTRYLCTRSPYGSQLEPRTLPSTRAKSTRRALSVPTTASARKMCARYMCTSRWKCRGSLRSSQPDEEKMSDLRDEIANSTRSMRERCMGKGRFERRCTHQRGRRGRTMRGIVGLRRADQGGVDLPCLQYETGGCTPVLVLRETAEQHAADSDPQHVDRARSSPPSPISKAISRASAARG
jgi:hypothetical protein